MNLNLLNTKKKEDSLFHSSSNINYNEEFKEIEVIKSNSLMPPKDPNYKMNKNNKKDFLEKKNEKNNMSADEIKSNIIN